MNSTQRLLRKMGWTPELEIEMLKNITEALAERTKWWKSPEKDKDIECTCTSLLNGCTCGAFKKEQEEK